MTALLLTLVLSWAANSSLEGWELVPQWQVALTWKDLKHVLSALLLQVACQKLLYLNP